MKLRELFSKINITSEVIQLYKEPDEYDASRRTRDQYEELLEVASWNCGYYEYTRSRYPNLSDGFSFTFAVNAEKSRMLDQVLNREVLDIFVERNSDGTPPAPGVLGVLVDTEATAEVLKKREISRLVYEYLQFDYPFTITSRKNIVKLTYPDLEGLEITGDSVTEVMRKSKVAREKYFKERLTENRCIPKPTLKEGCQSDEA